MMNIVRYSSPNFNGRDPAIPLSYIIVHYTGMETAEAALRRLTDSASEVSAHYMINEDGTVYQLVDEGKRAWHCGKSYWRGITDMNSASVGIELVNPGHAWGYRAFPPVQIAALKGLLQDVVARNKLNPRLCLLAHSDIAPDRREDPGELFPWQELATEGLGRWAAPTEIDYAEVKDMKALDQEVQAMLQGLGYFCPQTGDYDRDTRKALVAFQRHFEPNNMTGTPERETVARLRALTRG